MIDPRVSVTVLERETFSVSVSVIDPNVSVHVTDVFVLVVGARIIMPENTKKPPPMLIDAEIAVVVSDVKLSRVADCPDPVNEEPFSVDLDVHPLVREENEVESSLV